jgi:hypothetical protein
MCEHQSNQSRKYLSSATGRKILSLNGGGGTEEVLRL